MMLQKKYSLAAGEFAQELEQMKVIFGRAYSEFENESAAEQAQKLLLIKQIERLLNFMKEFSLHINDLFKQTSISEEQILFIFERQYKFKQIYMRHIEDFRKSFS